MCQCVCVVLRVVAVGVMAYTQKATISFTNVRAELHIGGLYAKLIRLGAGWVVVVAVVDTGVCACG